MAQECTTIFEEVMAKRPALGGQYGQAVGCLDLNSRSETNAKHLFYDRWAERQTGCVSGIDSVFTQHPDALTRCFYACFLSSQIQKQIQKRRTFRTSLPSTKCAETFSPLIVLKKCPMA